MEFMEFIDVLMIFSYFFTIFCFLLFTISKQIRRRLHKLKQRFYYEVLRKETSEHSTFLNPPYKPKTIEERREKTLDYLVKKYSELKKREEEYIKKLESYGKIKRWAYKRSRNLKNACIFAKESIVKPSMIFAMTYSTALSMYLGIRTGSQIAKLTSRYIPLPFNYVLDVLILFPIGFSPGILSIILGYYLEKERLKRMLEDYGVEI